MYSLDIEYLKEHLQLIFEVVLNLTEGSLRKHFEALKRVLKELDSGKVSLELEKQKFVAKNGTVGFWIF